MWKNYLVTAFRNLRKQRVQSFINIFGLAVGLAASLLIFLYIQRELSYDHFHSRGDRIHRVLLLDKSLGVSNTYAGITFVAMYYQLASDIPEVETAVRIMGRGRQAVQVGERRFFTDRMALADPTIFKVFDFGLSEGDPARALEEPYTAVLTRDLAETLFGGGTPVGRTFRYANNEIRVTGVLENIPETSHIRFDMLISLNYPDEADGYGRRLRNWGWISAPTYVLLKEGASADGLEEKLIGVLRKNDVGENFSVTHQPLHRVHLSSKNVVFDGNNINKGDIGYIYSLGAVAVVILLIAIFNFMNLSTARSTMRAREVGLRKVVGAGRRQLIGQFMGESLLLCVIGLIGALALLSLAAVWMNSAFDMNLDLSLLWRPGTAAAVLAVTAGMGLLAGSWPALVLSSFRPSNVLRSGVKGTAHGMTMRRVLVVVQFAISITLIIGSAVVYRQMEFIRGKDMGYDREQVAAVRMTPETAAIFEPLTDRLSRSPAILSWSSSGNLPGRTMNRTGIRPDGIPREDEAWVVSTMRMDEHFIETLGLELVAGRNFSREFGTDAEEAVIINQAAASALGWDDPIGKTFGNGDLKVVGLIRDFHFATLRHVVEPLVIRFNPGAGNNLSLKLRAGAIGEGISQLKAAWKELLPGHPLEYVFLDEEFDRLYRREEDFGSMTRGFTTLAIVIACLGLFGLAAHTVEQRTREIGIRKVLGAGIGGLVILLSRNFLGLVAAANLIAWPAAYWLMSRWLRDFAYRIDLDAVVFLASGAAALLIALVPVSVHAVRAAAANPIRALRYE